MSRHDHLLLRICYVAFFVLAQACDGPSDTAAPQGSVLATGMDVFSTPAFNQGRAMKDNSLGNSFACATCHDIGETSSDGFRRAGHSLATASVRADFKNGQLATLLEAVNSCRKDWMGAKTYTEESADWLLLKAYISEQTELESAASLSFAIKPAPTAVDLSGADKAAGQTLFNKSCAICHGANAVGTERGPALAGTTLTAVNIAAKVRTSGPANSEVYDGVSNGIMPFWSADKLADDELADIIAYLQATEALTEDEAANDVEDLSKLTAQSSCASTSAKIGQTLTLSTLQHRVEGTATIVDDCTIKIENFYFDGGGIDVQVYGANGLGSAAFTAGTSLSKNFLGTSFTGETAIFRLPTGVTLDDFDSLSVWCVAAGVSFGEEPSNNLSFKGDGPT